MLKRPAIPNRVQNRCKFTMSAMLQPFDIVPHNQGVKPLKQDECTSSRLLQSYGLVRDAGPGTFTLLPLGLRIQQKICRIIDQELERAGCLKISLPLLTSAKLWKQSGRLDQMGGELVRLRDRHEREVVLAPTHEEAVTSLLASFPVITPAQLPLRWPPAPPPTPFTQALSDRRQIQR